jgi:pSer/pThr/pTyr-binding forkhead associated (FHA) protein
MSLKTQIPRETILVIDKSEVFVIQKPVTKIGRATSNDLILTQMQVSRKHAEIHYRQDGFEIYDIGSTGGTYVNGKKMERGKLSKGDVIEIADVLLVFGHDELYSSNSSSEYNSPKGLHWRIQGTRFFKDPE